MNNFGISCRGGLEVRSIELQLWFILLFLWELSRNDDVEYYVTFHYCTL